MISKNKTAGRLANVSAVNSTIYTKNYTIKSNGRFNHELLPTPILVLSLLGIIPRKINRAGYWELTCPFHKKGQELHPSLNLHHVTGHFHCFACSEHGGDILGFYRTLTGKGFVDAARDLGAWEVEYE